MAPLLEARKLHSYYGSSHVLQGVDFSIGAGEVVALMGRNGMGKTTLLRSMLGLLKSRTGDPLPIRGGRSRRHFVLTGAGTRALREAQRNAVALWAGVGTVLRPEAT